MKLDRGRFREVKKPKQIGEREEVIDGQRVKVRVFEPFVPEPLPEQPMTCTDDSETPGQRYMRAERRRGADV